MAFSSLRSSLYLAKYALLKPSAKQCFRDVLRVQRLSRDELEHLNWTRTLALLRYAYDQVPYYRMKLDSVGLRPEDIRSVGDYANVPVLTRHDLREHFADLISREARPGQLRLSTTGGSTGQPVKVLHDKRVVRVAMRWRMLSWWGLPPGCDFASIYRETAVGIKSHLTNLLLYWPIRRIQLNAASFSDEDVRRFVRQYNEMNPPLLHGYVGAVDAIADYLLQTGITIHPPKAVWVTSAPLTAVQEARIQRAFGAPVYDQYGCCESYWLAAQCPVRGPLHMFHDTRRIEFLDDHNHPCDPGRVGNIAITDLENRLFPLIRYLNGDRGQSLPGDCPCGVTLPLMDKVRGRVSDNIKLKDGRVLSGEFLTTVFDEHPEAVTQFQILQKRDYSIEVFVVPDERYPRLGEALSTAERAIVEACGDKVPVSITRVTEIAQSGGKLRYIRSEIS